MDLQSTLVTSCRKLEEARKYIIKKKKHGAPVELSNSPTVLLRWHYFRSSVTTTLSYSDQTGVFLPAHRGSTAEGRHLLLLLCPSHGAAVSCNSGGG